MFYSKRNLGELLLPFPVVLRFPIDLQKRLVGQSEWNITGDFSVEPGEPIKFSGPGLGPRSVGRGRKIVFYRFKYSFRRRFGKPITTDYI